MNNVFLFGRLVRDPELRYTNSGTAFGRFTVAVDRGLSKDKKAEQEAKGQPTADFISCTAWGKTAEIIAQYFSKGNRIIVNGRIQTGSYEKDDGKKVYTTDVVVDKFFFVESSNGSTSNNNSYQNDQSLKSYSGKQASAFDSDMFPIDDDSIPF